MSIEDRDQDPFEHLLVKQLAIEMRDFGRRIAVGWRWATLERGEMIVLELAQACYLRDRLDEILRMAFESLEK